MKRKSLQWILLGIAIMGVGFVQGPEGPPTRVFTVGVWIAIFGIIGLTWAWATKPSGRGR